MFISMIFSFYHISRILIVGWDRGETKSRLTVDMAQMQYSINMENKYKVMNKIFCYQITDLRDYSSILRNLWWQINPDKLQNSEAANLDWEYDM